MQMISALRRVILNTGHSIFSNNSARSIEYALLYSEDEEMDFENSDHFALGQILM